MKTNLFDQTKGENDLFDQTNDENNLFNQTKEENNLFDQPMQLTYYITIEISCPVAWKVSTTEQLFIDQI